MQEDKLHKDDLSGRLSEEEQKKAEENIETQDDDQIAKDEVIGEEEEKSAALLEAKIQEYEVLFNRYQRLQADFENYKRRSRKELEDMAKFGAERLVMGLLPVLDNFSRAIEAAPQDGEVGKFMSGMDMIYRQCLEVLKNEGVKTIEAVGQPFDPEKHHAVMQVEAQNAEEDNLVKEELQVGYTLNDKVIRPSMVKVAKWG